MNGILSGLAVAVRTAGVVVLTLQVCLVAFGVSVPANAADKSKTRAEREEHSERRRLRDSQGQRGHVRRRNDVIRNGTHVDKKPGWRRID